MNLSSEHIDTLEQGVKKKQKPRAKTSAERQREFRKRQKELGRKSQSFWLTDEEYQKLKEYLSQIRQNKPF
jgi:hypothetical protein